MNIVVGYADFPGAEKALEMAARYARAFNGKIYVITSLVGGESVTHDELEHAKTSLQKARARFEAEQIPVEVELLVRGLDPGEDVVEFAKEVNAEHVVIAIRRKSKVGKLLFGSNAQHIILNAPCPVVTVK